MSEIAEITISSKEWGDVKVLRPIPKLSDPWGILAPLRETPWAASIPVVSGLVFSHALHGLVVPLMNVIGPEPHALLRLIPAEYRRCAEFKPCIMRDAAVCHPCVGLPDCYVPPEVAPEARDAARTVALAWRDGRYVVVVEGPEFSY